MSDALAVNDHANGYRARRSHRHNGSVSVGLSHAHVCREKKPPAKVAKPKADAVAPIVAPTVAKPRSLVISEAITSYDDLRAAFCAAKNLRGLSNSHSDELCNLASGHSDAILGPARRKNFGPLSFDAFLWAYAIKLVMVVDVEREAEVAVHWVDRQRQIAHVREPSRVSKILIRRVMSALGKKSGEMRRARKSAQTAESNP